jgi:hypothetical protein
LQGAVAVVERLEAGLAVLLQELFLLRLQPLTQLLLARGAQVLRLELQQGAQVALIQLHLDKLLLGAEAEVRTTE